VYCVILDVISKQAKRFSTKAPGTGARAQVRIQKIGNICNNARSTIMQAQSIIMLITGTYITANAKSSGASRSKRSIVAQSDIAFLQKYCRRKQNRKRIVQCAITGGRNAIFFAIVISFRLAVSLIKPSYTEALFVR